MRKKPATKENYPVGVVCLAPWRLTKVVPLENYELEVEFNDGRTGIVEVRKLIMSKHAGVFAVLQDKERFNKAYVEYGVTWPGDIDLAPDAMYDAVKQTGRWILR